QRGFIVDDHTREATQHIRSTHQTRICDLTRNRLGFLESNCRSVHRLRYLELVHQLSEPLAILSKVDRFRRGSNDWDSCVLQVQREVQRSLTSELHNHACRFFFSHDVQHVFERKRLEVQ